MNTIKKQMVNFIKDECGQSLAEYALILALVAIVVVVAVTGLGEKITSTFNNITGKLPDGNGSN